MLYHSSVVCIYIYINAGKLNDIYCVKDLSLWASVCCVELILRDFSLMFSNDVKICMNEDEKL